MYLSVCFVKGFIVCADECTAPATFAIGILISSKGKFLNVLVKFKKPIVLKPNK